MANNSKRCVLHTEVGGAYGGSLRALELYLQFADRTRFEHDVVFYYPTPGMQCIAPLVRSVRVLNDSLPKWVVGSSALRAGPITALKKSALGSVLRKGRSWWTIPQNFPTARQICTVLKSSDYRVVHINNTFTYQPASVMACGWEKIPIISHVRNPVPNNALNRMLMKQLHMVATVSENYEQELTNWGLKVPVLTCHDGVAVRPADVSVVNSIRSALVPQGQFLIGSVGRLDSQKGYDLLVRAARQVIDHRPDVRVVIAGDGPMKSELEALIHSLGLTGVVQLCGFRKDISEFISALDLFVSASRWEGLPIAVIEAMLLKRPVVATNVGGVSEVVKPGKTGYLLSPEDPCALANSVLQALRDIERSTPCYVDDAFRLAVEVTDPELSAQKFDRCLEECSQA